MKKIYLVVDRSGFFDDDMYEGTEPDSVVVMAFEHIADAKSWIESEGTWKNRFHGHPGVISDMLKCGGEPPKWHHIDVPNSDGYDWYGGYYFDVWHEYDEIGYILEYTIQEIELH